MLGCGKSHPCPDHTRQRTAGAHHAIYGTARWRTFRLRVLRQRPWCEHCLAKGLPKDYLTGRCTDTTTGRSSDVHHKVDLADGGPPFEPSNVEALSHPCHSRTTRSRQQRYA